MGRGLRRILDLWSITWERDWDALRGIRREGGSRSGRRGSREI